MHILSFYLIEEKDAQNQKMKTVGIKCPKCLHENYIVADQVVCSNCSSLLIKYGDRLKVTTIEMNTKNTTLARTMAGNVIFLGIVWLAVPEIGQFLFGHLARPTAIGMSLGTIFLIGFCQILTAYGLGHFFSRK